MKFNKIKNIILKFTIISFFLLEVFTSEIFAQNLKDLQKAAAKAVDAASVCYRSLPSHAQNSAVNSMLDARRYYEDAVKWLEQVKLAYLASNQQEDWRSYRQQLMEVNSKKRKLMEIVKRKGL